MVRSCKSCQYLQESSNLEVLYRYFDSLDDVFEAVLNAIRKQNVINL